MIPLQLELGGKDVCLVLEDIDLDLVAANIIKVGFSYSGRRYKTIKVVVVMESIAGALVGKMNAGVVKLRVGQPEDNCNITPVVIESSSNFIEGLVMDVKEKGASFCPEWVNYLIWPLLLDNVRADMRTAWEEPFGFVLPVIKINSNEEGTHRCLFIKDINRAVLISNATETGIVQINSAPAYSPYHFPFKCLKDNGISSQGKTNSINMMTKVKSTVISFPSSSYTMG
uniref:NADP-dependent glyceraldehyde-3-phosphate dehydrogenase n=1 Tax=Manihot esculenta TaxID=3983 RepID=A0A2C9VEP7_MANES